MQNKTWDPESEKQKMDLEATIKALKGYLRNKTITSQNVSSEG